MVSKILILPFFYNAVSADSAKTFHRHASQVKPIQKVIQLLSDLEANCQTEASDEASTYDKFATYCKDKTTSLSDSITDGRDKIDLLSSEIAEKTSQRTDKSDKLQDTKAKKEQLTVELKETEVRCEEKHAKYQAVDADNRKAISSLEKAIKSMEDAKPAAAAAGLLTVKRTIESSPGFAAAMKELDAGAKWSSLLEVDPSDPEYKHHSQGIIDLLNNLHDEFMAKKETDDAEWKKVNQACIDKKADLNEQLDTAANTISNLEIDIDNLSTRLAEARGELVESDNTLKDDKLYLTDLTGLCETRANEFDQRSKMRGDELAALGGALKVLRTKVSDADAANERALLLQQTEPWAFVQTGEDLNSVVNKHEQHQVQQVDQRREAAISKLTEEGRRLKSSLLLSLAARAGADPFKKVKGLIQKLIERLIAESTAEATKKGFCDTEVSKAEKDRDYRRADIKKLKAEIGVLESKEESLTTDIKELKEKLAMLDDAAKEASTLRDIERSENLAQIKMAKGGLNSVNEAIGILKNFYKSAAKAKVLLQTAASPVDEDSPGAASGAYKGNQAASAGIFGLLDVIKSDFEHTIDTVSAEEKKAAADYVEFDRRNKVATKGADTKKERNTEDLAETRSTLDEKRRDLQSNEDLLQTALDEIEELRPICIDTGMTYDDRVAKREAEIKALNNAMCMLDADKVEPECQ